jgi:BirA family biotin operon repressor/biotin-[acetyl-CoA-carboxylase] ligase
MPPPTWLIELPTCDSTNTWALDHSAALANGACVYTRNQSAGRGQPGKTWYAPPGVLTVSVVLDLASIVAATQLSLAAGLAVAHAIEDCVPAAQVRLKWPNDCLIAGRKIAGVLCEQAAREPDRVVVGIGLNIDPRWDQLPESLPLVAAKRWSPASLAEITTTPPQPLDIITQLRRYLLEATGMMSAGGWQRLIPELTARDALAGHAIRIDTPTGQISGTAMGLDGNGRLLVRTTDGVTAIASARMVTMLSE